MDITLLPLIETTIPSDLRINENGVVQNALVAEFLHKKAQIRFSVICVNGLWAGGEQLSYSIGGCGGPIFKEDAEHPSFDICLEHLWQYALDYFSRSRDSQASDACKLLYKRWKALSKSQQRALFKEQSVYRYINIYNYGKL